jgi:tRNA-Thr(GGU) m(6)t(6)A37 methyltransferase TsaA
MKIEYQPIGIIHTPHAKIEGMPIQPSKAKDVAGTVEVFHKYTEGLADLNGFSHIILLYHFHKSKGYQLKVVPFLDTELRGLFSTRAPKRPNPIGLSVVRLLGIEKSMLSVLDVDILDGTPLLDIKPYVSEFDEPANIRLGWLENARKRHVRSDSRFK